MSKHTEINLKNVATCKLFEELKNREGVELKWAEPETECKIDNADPREDEARKLLYSSSLTS